MNWRKNKEGTFIQLLFGRKLGESVVTDKSKQILRDTLIDEDQPGTTLRDFESLLAFLGSRGVATTSKYYLLAASEPIRRAECADELSRTVSLKTLPFLTDDRRSSS